MSKGPLVIVGASYAGLQVAASARDGGFEEPILLVGDEPHAPYQRPPLSKGLLTGKATEAQLALRAPAFFQDNRIELLTGTRVEAIDPAARRVTLAGGKVLSYGWLALATGASCRQLALPGCELAGIHPLRTLDDARTLALAATYAERVCVIGAGYIGLEVAAALRSLGKQVTVLESAPRVLSRSMPAVMSDHIEEVHRAHGVDLRMGQALRALHGSRGHVEAVQLADGTQIACELVVLGIGVVPNAELAAACGIAVGNGIETDACGRTSAPHVLAAGDVASMALALPGMPSCRLRLESVQAANDGGRAAATAIVGRPQPCAAVPWFWSDQFDLKLQMAGIALPGDEAVIRGDMQAGKFCVGYLREGHLAALHSVNRPAEHMLARRLIAARARISPDELRDTSFDLRQLLEPAQAATSP